MSVSVTELFTDHVVVTGTAQVGERSVVSTTPDPRQVADDDLLAPPVPWYDGLSFSGPLDPAGTLFAFLLALAATVGLVVMVAAVVRMVSAG
jgi:hypothetical protein